MGQPHPSLPDQVEDIEVASHGLWESLTSAGWGLMHAQFSVPWVQVARSPVSQLKLTELWPCMSGTTQLDCPWSCGPTRFSSRVLSGLEPVDVAGGSP